MAYFDKFARIHFLNDARKKAKREAYAAQKVYEECCSDLAKEKDQLDSFFKALCSDDDMTHEKE